MPKSISYEQHRKLKKWYEEQLKSKDKVIEELAKERDALMKTALRQAHRTKEWQRVAEELDNK